MPYEYLEDIATADAAFRAWGKSLEEMFVAAAEATMNVMVADLNTIASSRELKLHLEEEAVEMLLFELLQELIFYKDAQQLLLRISGINIEQAEQKFTLDCRVHGERLNPQKHELTVDVKAVTLHRYQVQRTALGWEATVVLDI